MRSSSFLLCDIVLYAGPLRGSIGGFGVGFLVRLRVHAAMVSSSLVMLLSGLGVGLGKTFFTLGYGVVIIGNLRDGGMSNTVCGGGIYFFIGNLGDVCLFSSSSVCV